jgi:hypothetical protein
MVMECAMGDPTRQLFVKKPVLLQGMLARAPSSS